MDELSPKAEAKNMELVATRGEEEQGSEAQFSPPLGGNEAKRTLRRRVSPGRATYFLPAQKVGKDAHRGCASDSHGAKGAPCSQSATPYVPPVYGGAKQVPVSIDRRTGSTLCAPLGGLRPGAAKPAALLRRLWAPGAGVQACGPRL